LTEYKFDFSLKSFTGKSMSKLETWLQRHRLSESFKLLCFRSWYGRVLLFDQVVWVDWRN